jgi:hypothetical protein
VRVRGCEGVRVWEGEFVYKSLLLVSTVTEVVYLQVVYVLSSLLQASSHLPVHSITFDACSFSSHSLPLAITLFLLRFVRFIRGENEYTKGTSHIWRRDPFALLFIRTSVIVHSSPISVVLSAIISARLTFFILRHGFLTSSKTVMQ